MGATILHMGDCGVGRNPGRSMKKLASHAKNRDQTIMIIRGNHDNPKWYPHKFSDNVRLLGDYTELEFPNGTNGICVGGGISLDRSISMLGYDYWDNETTPFRPHLCTPSTFLFLHDAPSYFNNQSYTLKVGHFSSYIDQDESLMADCIAQRDVIDKITELCTPKYIYGGHFHNSVSDRIDGVTYRCLNINELYLLHADIGLDDSDRNT